MNHFPFFCSVQLHTWDSICFNHLLNFCRSVKKNPCHKENQDLFGNDLNFCGDKTDTAYKCQELCQETPLCVQFTWLGKPFGGREKECCMKNKFNHNYDTSFGATSGPKFCGI